MTLTLGRGPLSGDPAPSNYSIDGPAHRIFIEPTAKRVRIEVAGETVADSVEAKLLHETGLLPVYYIPRADVRDDLLQPTDHHTTCPFKGEASYFSVVVGDHVEENLVWYYPEPIEGVAAIADHVAFYLRRVDAVYEEAVRLVGHPRDPYHRVDTMRSDRHVRVTVGDQVVAETYRPIAVFETGLPARWYIPREDVVTERLEPSDTVTVCPYKGVATWWSLTNGPKDAAWSYAEPLPEGTGLPGHLCFGGDDVTVEVTLH
jgi:uncharacterized protein (DUF427 family)